MGWRGRFLGRFRFASVNPIEPFTGTDPTQTLAGVPLEIRVVTLEAIEMLTPLPILVGELEGDGLSLFLLRVQSLQVKGAAATEHCVDTEQRQQRDAAEDGDFVFPRYWG